MAIADLARNLERFTIANSPVILTAVAVTGTVTATVLAGKASFKAAELIAEEESKRKLEQKIGLAEDFVPMDAQEKAKLIWMLYIPAASTCVTTIAAIICANQIATRRAAAMAAAYSLSEKAFGEYKDKVVEKIGEKKELAVRDELAQERIAANPPSNQVVMVNSGDVLCYDQHSGRYFQSDMETLKKAQNDTNYRLLNDGYVSLNDFYDHVGLEMLPTGEELGWSNDKQVELIFTSVLSTDQRPCLAFDFRYGPTTNYYKGH